MNGDSILDERTLHEVYLPAFEMAVRDGKTRSVMCAYNQVNGEFCAENKLLLNDILRDKWGFGGFVVTDWGAVKDRVKGIVSGLDLQMPGSAGHHTDAMIVDAVKSGALDMADLDRTVLRLLEFIAEGMKLSTVDSVFDRQKDHDKAVDIAKECAVLLKNDDNALPIKKGVKAVFIGEFAKKPRYQGAGSSYINSYKVTSALDIMGGGVTYAQGYAIKPGQDDNALLSEAVNAAKNAEAAVIFAGLPDAFESEGFDRKTMSMPDNQNKLIEAVAAVQPNTVVVLHGGAPIELPWLSKVKAVLCMYLGGEGVGKATVDLLYGDAVPSGKLAETWPVKLSDNPSYLSFPGEDGVVEYREGIYIGYRYYDKKEMNVLFPFGHGLSYTEFEYSSLTIDKAEMNDTDILTVRLKIKNTGGTAGKEAVQLYVKDVESSAGRPVRELKGIAKVSLASGEEKEIVFTLDKRSFAYYEPKIHDWFVESGVFAIEAGASSRDIRLSAEVNVKGTKALPIVFSINSPMGLVMAHPKGQELFSQMRPQGIDGGDMSALGEGAEEMARAMMQEMPLGGLVNFGMMTQEQLQGIIAMLNG